MARLDPNIPHVEGAIKAACDKRGDKSTSTDNLMNLAECVLAECVLKNNIFEHNSCYFKHKQGTAISTKMAPQYISAKTTYMVAIY